MADATTTGPTSPNAHGAGDGDTFDVVVIGGGPTGENVAQYAHDGGLSVLLVEAGLLGGECSYYACMPSKALLRPVAVADTTAHLGGLTRAQVVRDELLARRDAWVSHYDDKGQLSWATGAGLEVARGRGRLVGERRVEVTGDDGVRSVTARRAVVVATGSVAVVPGALAAARPWTSRDATGVVEVPDRLVVVGGGVVAVEAATWLSALGSDVTLLVRGDRLLASQEEFAGEFVRDALTGRGVRVVTGASVTGVEREDARDTGLGRVHGGPVTVVTEAGDRFEADEVVVATGRRPALDDLGLEAVGVTADQVAAGDLPDWLHAIGDAGTGAPLTHMGKYAARVLGARLAGSPLADPPREVPVPQVVFTDPEVAAVGLTEAEARDRGLDVAVSEVAFTDAAGGGLLRDDATGRAKLVVDAGEGVVVGATFVGPEVAELLHSATVAIVGGVPVEVLRHAVPSYPTASELWLRLLEGLPRGER